MNEVHQGNLHGSRNTCTDMSHVCRYELGKTKIWNFWGQIFVKKNIACFYVSMDNMWSHFLVKIGKPPCNSDANFNSRSPAKLDTGVTATWWRIKMMRSTYLITPKKVSRLLSKRLLALLRNTIKPFVATTTWFSTRMLLFILYSVEISSSKGTQVSRVSFTHHLPRLTAIPRTRISGIFMP